ncbi:OmpA family protein [Alteromonas sp. PRIM-21]|uniref:OmpA family protein n=1 Tax=Alteromonas sp. PRIM-21 TaxID=1454978 RepID=UPI0022B9AC22|nr:OmpA family protein [Alteromonas sp. PRIM-21]MCZ8528789.1 OmpA family protein [Alteromonas sp. PRIM-21]
MKRTHLNKSVVLALTAPFFMTSCATIGDMSKTALGCIGGAAIGGVGTLIATGDPRKALAGTVIGGIAGCAIGNYLDYREQQLKQAAKANGFEPEFERIALDKKKGTTFSQDAEEDVIAAQVSLNSDKPLFESSQFRITDPEKLKNLKAFLKKYVEGLGEGSKVYVVGHTDSSGSSAFNQKLSENRASYIASLLSEAGLNESNIYYEGVGESQPVASNATSEGRARNRRFELVDVIHQQLPDEAEQLNTAPIENVVEVAIAKKQRIENVTNTLPEKKVRKKPKVEVKASPALRHETLGLDGVPLKSFDQQAIVSAFGQQQDDGWGFFAKANANSDAPIMGSCAYTTPVVKSRLRDFKGRPVVDAEIGEHIPNLYKNSWFGEAGSTTVVLSKVGIKADTYEPTSTPIYRFFKDYKGGNVKPDYEYPVSVETYKGDGAVLLRMYAKDDNSLLKCSDVVFSTDGLSVAKASAVIYQDRGEIMAKAYKLQAVKG